MTARGTFGSLMVEGNPRDPMGCLGPLDVAVDQRLATYTVTE